MSLAKWRDRDGKRKSVAADGAVPNFMAIRMAGVVLYRKANLRWLIGRGFCGCTMTQPTSSGLPRFTHSDEVPVEYLWAAVITGFL